MKRKISVILLAVCLVLCSGCEKSSQEKTMRQDTLSNNDKTLVSETVELMVKEKVESYGAQLTSVDVEDYDPGEEYADKVWYEARVNISGTADLSLLEKAYIAQYIAELHTGDVEDAMEKELQDTILRITLYGDDGEYLFSDSDGTVSLFEGSELIIFNKTWQELGGETSAADTEPLSDGELEYEEFKNYFRVLEIETSDPNSAGGVDVDITYRKTSDATDDDIKYVWFTVVPYNRVGDAEASEIGGKSKTTIRYVGPIDDNEKHTITSECCWYNSDIDYAEIVKVEIEYMDGTIVSCSDVEGLN